MSIFNFSSVDPKHYNRIKATIPNHFLSRTVSICVSTLTSNCNIEVMNEEDYIEFEIAGTRHKVFMNRQSKISTVSLPDILHDIFDISEVPITVEMTDIDTIKFICDNDFSIIDMSYNMKLICGFYCLDDSEWPIRSIKTTVKQPDSEQEEVLLKDIAYEDIYVRTGEYKMITYRKLSPSDAYGFTCVYSNPDESIAVINDEGYIVSKKPGKVEISVEIRNPGVSEYMEPDFMRVFTITVKDPEEKKVERLSVPKEIILKKHEIMSIYPKVEPFDAKYSWRWHNDNSDIAKIDQAGSYVRAMKVGTTKIHYIITNTYTEDGKKIVQHLDEEITITVKSELKVEKNVITSDTVGYMLSTPILYLLTNIGNHVFFNEMHNSKRLQCGTVCMCLNNSFSSSFPIIASQGEIITRCSIGHASDIWFILVDANMKEVKLLNPMYITVSVRPDDSDPSITPGLL